MHRADIKSRAADTVSSAMYLLNLNLAKAKNLSLQKELSAAPFPKTSSLPLKKACVIRARKVCLQVIPL